MASMAVSCDEEEEAEELSYTITKTATDLDTAGNGVIDIAGEIIEYTVEVENTGTATITGVSVSDSLSITLTRQDDDPGDNDADLDEGETWVYTGSYTAQQSDLDAGSIENTATVSSNELGDKSDTEEVSCGTQTVKIGVILPLTGEFALYGQEFKNGIEFVLDQMEAEGALPWANIEVIWADDGNDPQQSATEMTRLCTTEGVCATLGPFATECGLAACPLADTYQIPNIGIAVTGDEISDLNLEYFRTIVPEVVPGDYGRGMVDFIKYCIDNYDLPHERIVMLSTTDPTGQQQHDAQLAQLEYYGLDENLVLDMQYDITSPSMDAYALQCKAKDPDIMFGFSLPVDLAGWITSMYTIDYYPNIFVSADMILWDVFTQLFIQPSIYDAVFSTDHTSPFCPAAGFPNVPLASCRANYEAFAAWCEENNKTNLWETGGVTLTGQAMYALWDALEIAGEADPEKINDAFLDLVIPYDSPHFMMPALYPAVEWNSNGTLKNYFLFVLGKVDGETVIVYPDEWKQADPQW